MKKTPLHRYTPLRSTGRLKRAKKGSAQREEFRDSTGLAFSDVRAYMERHYGSRVSDWPSAKAVIDDSVERLMHEWFPRQCWVCGNGLAGVQAHHLVGGSRGRSDEFTNIVLLCRPCHEQAHGGKLAFGRLIYLKWLNDPQHLNYGRLSLLKRAYLPDLITG